MGLSSRPPTRREKNQFHIWYDPYDMIHETIHQYSRSIWYKILHLYQPIYPNIYIYWSVYLSYQLIWATTPATTQSIPLQHWYLIKTSNQIQPRTFTNYQTTTQNSELWQQQQKKRKKKTISTIAKKELFNYNKHNQDNRRSQGKFRPIQQVGRMTRRRTPETAEKICSPTAARL